MLLEEKRSNKEGSAPSNATWTQAKEGMQQQPVPRLLMDAAPSITLAALLLLWKFGNPRFQERFIAILSPKL